jgi:hypothetical protein
MTEAEFKRRTLIKLSKGNTSLPELIKLKKIYQDNYKKTRKDLNACIEYQVFNELIRRLKKSVFSETGKSYPVGYKKYCISGEYYNTKLFIDTTKKIVNIGHKFGDITNPNLFGQSDSKYKITIETIVHLLIRHNEAINNLINRDSAINGHNPSSFNGAIALPLLTMFMALNALEDSDWKQAEIGKNLVCHFAVCGQIYTLIRKGNSKEIRTFYPRNDNLDLDLIRLKRKADRMEFEKE